jgi:phospholipid/cholesterol/gamma-HCH transport system substrate-binding protein
MSISRYVKVALFFIVLGSAGIVYVVMSAEGFTTFNTSTYHVALQDATGLSTRSKVYMAGVAVGKVHAIDLEGNTARMRLIILKDVELRQNAVVSRKSSSILGTFILSLDPGSAPNPVLPPGGTIQIKTGTDMNALIGTASEIGTQISEILAEFRQNQMALLAVSLETFNSIAAKIDARADDELDRISRILESVVQITERANWILAEREDDISVTLLEIRLTMENIRKISETIAQGKGNIGQAIYDDRLYSSLLSTVEQAEETMKKLQTVFDEAGNLIGGINGVGIQVDTRANYGFNSKYVRAGASLRLEPASGDRWYRIGVNGVPDGVTTRTFTTTTTSAGTDYEDKTETKYTFSIDAELARRFGIVTIHGGLLESTAGFGVDIKPLRWASISGELFNFRTGQYPNLRGTVSIYPFFNPNGDNPLNWLYLYGGVYDALSSKRDFFLGGGLRFSDRDIKSLAGLAASTAAAR